MISPSFTNHAADLISKHLDNYETKRLKVWPNNSAAHAVVVRSNDKVDEDFLRKHPELEILVTATSGFDHLDLSLVQKTSVKFCHSPKANVVSASELTFWHILNFLKKGPQLNSKAWNWRKESLLGTELADKNVALIGLGRIGSSVAKKLQAFGCSVLAHDPFLSDETIESFGVESVTLKQALTAADIVSLHCPLTSKTKHIINQESISLMSPSSFLVNCARGALVDERSLLIALKEQKIAGACLDVFEIEPLAASSSLRHLENVSLSPHLGGYTHEAQNKSALEAAQQVKNWFEQDQPVLNVLPPAYKWAKDLED